MSKPAAQNICAKCRKIFSTANGLKKHAERKTPCDKAPQCSICGRIFKTSLALTNHSAKCKTVPIAPAPLHAPLPIAPAPEKIMVQIDNHQLMLAHLAAYCEGLDRAMDKDCTLDANYIELIDSSAYILFQHCARYLMRKVALHPPT